MFTFIRRRLAAHRAARYDISPLYRETDRRGRGMPGFSSPRSAFDDSAFDDALVEAFRCIELLGGRRLSSGEFQLVRAGLTRECRTESELLRVMAAASAHPVAPVEQRSDQTGRPV